MKKVGAGLQRGTTIKVRCKPYPHGLPFPAKSPAPDDLWFLFYFNLTVALGVIKVILVCMHSDNKLMGLRAIFYLGNRR